MNQVQSGHRRSAENLKPGTMQCGRGTSFGHRLVENYDGLVPFLWKTVLRFKESRSPSGSYKKVGDMRDESDVLEAQWGSGGAKPSSTRVTLLSLLTETAMEGHDANAQSVRQLRRMQACSQAPKILISYT